MRRLRANTGIRAMLKETQLVPAQLIQPIFVTEGETPEAVASMPGVERLPIPLLVEKCRELVSLGVYGVALFPKTPDEKKTWLENFLYRFWMNLFGEVNPFGLIPGYSDAVTLLKKGELSDDAMGAIGKILTAGRGTIDLLINGAGDKGLERALEANSDIHTESVVVETYAARQFVADTDEGQELAERIADLEDLLDAYRTGVIATKGQK